MHTRSDQKSTIRAKAEAAMKTQNTALELPTHQKFSVALEATCRNDETKYEMPTGDNYEDQTTQSVKHALVAMIVAAAVLLLFNSGGLRTWVRNLPGNSATDFLVQNTDRWHDGMKRLGTVAPKSVVQNVVADFRNSDWPAMGGISEAQASEGTR